MSDPLLLDGAHLTVADVVEVARMRRPARLHPDARAEMQRSYRWVAEAGLGTRPIYGVNTGFGSLARVRIAAENRAKLSVNLVRSHAAGVGRPLPSDAVRAMMLLRANALARGASGCRPLLVDRILELLELDLLPVVPEQGSCGSSGDLAPLAHLGLVLIGDPEGEATWRGRRLKAPDALAEAGLSPIQLEAKDGLAITNGAQLTTGLAALAVHDAERVLLAAEVAAALSIEALRGATRAFHPAVHALRPYVGAVACAANLRHLLRGSRLVDSVPGKVQDAYSLRCTPPVLGACRDALAFVASQVSVELNAVTDNPLILVDADGEDKAFSGGLFHGEPVGIPMDVLKIAVAEVASLAERRLYRLTTGTLSARLPPALARRDRPELGMMLPQTTAAALVSENKGLCWPASVDSIPTCEDQEDHVAMSTTAARRAHAVVRNARGVVAIELLGASAALAFRREEEGGAGLGEGTALALSRVEAALGQLPADRLPSDAIAALDGLVASGELERGLGLIPVGARGEAA